MDSAYKELVDNIIVTLSWRWLKQLTPVEETAVGLLAGRGLLRLEKDDKRDDYLIVPVYASGNLPDKLV